MTISDNGRKVLTLILCSVLLFLLGNQVVSLSNPDEVFYAGTAKEMAQQHTWTVPYLFSQPQFEKPILTYWLIRAAFLVFGTTPFAARFFPAFFALLGVLGVYFLCARVYGDRKRAFWCAFVLMSGVLYIGLARTVFTDMIFSIFTGLSLGAFYLGYHDRKWRPAGLVLFFVFSGLAVLTKGLLGLTIPLGAVLLFLYLRRELGYLWCRSTVLGVILLTAIAVPWYVLMIAKFGRAFIDELWVNDHVRRLAEAEHAHNDKWYFYPGAVLLCFFPWTIWTAASFGHLVSRLKEKSASPFAWFLACWIAAGFLQVQVAHSKLVSYIFPIFPAVAIITGDFLRETLIVEAECFAFLPRGYAGKARGFALTTLVVFLLLPPAAVVAAYRYPSYVGRPDLACIVMGVFLAIVLVQIWLVKKNVRLFPYAAAFNLAFLFFAVLTFAPYVDDMVASRGAGEYVRQEQPAADSVLCSKMIVRGVRYYSDKEVGVLKLGGGAFFSAHPIPFIDSNEELLGYLKARPRTIAVLEKKDLAAVRAALDGRYECVLLKQFGGQSVVKFVGK
ncbi:MAG: glycosyltransferase family 39 protein [Candidatus Omnitrophica bacterium]|nr:glycosyltransferase family 39 protein [Candidatus Omnitrophota bacterium]